MPLTPLLFLSPRLPWPLLTGARIRTHALLGALREEFEVHYAGFSAPGAAISPGAREYFSGLRVVALAPERALARPAKAWLALRTLASRTPVTIAKYWDGALAAAVRNWLAGHPGALVHADHLHMAPYLALPGPAALRAMDEHNVESVIVERLARETGNRLVRAYLRLQARRMRALEAALAARAGLTLAVSAGDAAELGRMAPGARVEVIPNGVDLDYFSPPAPPRRPCPGRLIFTGSMDWRPNQDAVIFFVRQIMPHLQAGSGAPLTADAADWSLDIVGHNPGPAVRALAAQDVRVTGTVPDVRPFVNEAQVYIVPLRVGGGSRLKILEAFAMGIPVVSTAIGCEGLDVHHGRHLLVADAPEAFADAVARLAADPALAERLTREATRHVRDRFGWGAIGKKLVDLYKEATGPQPSPLHPLR